MIKRNVFLVMVVLLLMCICFIQGCPKNISFSDMSSQEKATWMLSMYNSQYASYMTAVGYSFDGDTWEQTSFPELTDKQKEVLVKQKDILIEVYPLIKIYDSYIQNGALPKLETEEQIMDLLDKLLAL